MSSRYKHHTSHSLGSPVPLVFNIHNAKKRIPEQTGGVITAEDFVMSNYKSIGPDALGLRPGEARFELEERKERARQRIRELEHRRNTVFENFNLIRQAAANAGAPLPEDVLRHIIKQYNQETDRRDE